MFSVLRRRFTYANVMVTLALVFAMSGGAYAASKFLITSTKQIKPSVLAQLKGKAGANGASGATGPAGPAGPLGAAGPQGPAGAAGAKGDTGPAGPAGPQGEKGVAGAKGAAGSPWTAGGTLPSGAAETGTWGLSKLPVEEGPFSLQIPISFTVPLAAPLDEAHVHTIEPEAGLAGQEPVPSGCSLTRTGETVEVNAEPGNLCLYVQFAEGLSKLLLLSNHEAGGVLGAGKTGAILTNKSGASLKAGSFGTGYWIVRAP
jgi:hypothetical protein